MNERIRELAEQAGFENGHQDRNGNSLSYELEKFARLIIQEANDVVYGLLEKNTGAEVVVRVCEHFGVGE